MSLINDALKRARVEALRQEETERRTYRAVPAHSRRPDRRHLLLIGGWTTAALAVALAAWMWLSADAETARELVEPAPSVTGAPAPGSAAASIDSSPIPMSPESARADAGRQPGNPGTPRSPAIEDPAGLEEDRPEAVGVTGPARRDEARETSAGTVDSQASSSTPPPVVEPRAATVGGGSAAAGRRRLEPGKTYLRSATAADGSVVELGGIAYSDSRPIAVINGSVVASGDLIGGFTVVSIEPERVELEADGVRIYLALR